MKVVPFHTSLARAGSARSLDLAWTAAFGAGALLLLGLLAQGARAQGALAGSPSFTALSQELQFAGGTGQSPSFSGEVGAGQLTTGLQGSSPGFQAIGGIVWLEGVNPGGPPVLFSTDGKGEQVGGEVETLVGLNFTAPGAQVPPTVLVGGAPSPSVFAVQDTSLQFVSPPGVNVFGNPLGQTSISLSNGLGFAFLPDAYVYQPALVAATPAQVGQDFVLQFTAPTATFYIIAVGGSIPGVAIPDPVLAGALELVVAPTFLTGLQFAPTGEAQLVFSLPSNPGLIGKVVEFQAAAIPSVAPLTGSFTNRLVVVILP